MELIFLFLIAVNTVVVIIEMGEIRKLLENKGGELMITNQQEPMPEGCVLITPEELNEIETSSGSEK